MPSYATIVDDGSYNGTPGFSLMPNGDYVVTYNKTACHVCSGLVVVRRSSDRGLTWTAEQTVFDHNAGTDPLLLLTPDNVLRVYFDKSDSTTNSTGYSSMASTDFGITWPNAPVFLQSPPSKLFAGDNFLTVGGTIYFAAYGTDPTTSATGVYLFTSTDNAQTWTRGALISTLGNETGIAYLGGSNLLTVMRDAGSTKTYKFTSSDMGQTWSGAVDITAQVGVLQFPVLTWVGNTLMLTARQFISNTDGKMAAYFSTDGGATFANGTIIEDYLGQAIDGGYSAAVALNDNVAYVVYYADLHDQRLPAIRSVLMQMTPRSVVIGNASVASETSDAAVLPTMTFDGGTLKPTVATVFPTPVFLNSAGIVDTSLADVTLSGAIAGAGSVTKNGTGILRASATSSYTGVTVLNAGTLLVNGDISTSASMTVNSGAVLGGNGAVPPTTVVSDGTLSPGDSIGTLKIAGDLTFGNAANAFNVDVTPGQADQLNVTGAATLNGAVNVNATAGTYGQRAYTILHAAGGISGQFASLVVTGDFGSGLNPHLVYGAQDVFLVLGPDAVYSTATALQTSTNPSGFGQSVTFTATVTSNGGTPGGTLTFLDGAVSIGSGLLSNGVAALTTAALASGTHSITASYAGNSLYDPSTSAATNETINPAASTTMVASSAQPSVFGQPVTFTASVTSSGGIPSGTVAFADGATSLGTKALAAGSAAVTTANLSVGTHTIKATYSGDANFAAGSGTISQVVNKAVTTMLVSAKPNPALPRQSIVVRATVSVTAPGSSTLAGTVTFKERTKTLGTANLVAGKANFTASGLAIGSHTIVASYAGSASFKGSSGSANVVVDPRVGPEFRVNVRTADAQEAPATARLNDGSFMVAWQSHGQDGSGYGIFARHYSAAGKPISQEFRVNTHVTNDQTAPSVARLSDGGFVITWQSNGEDGSGLGIYGQRYSAKAARVGNAFRVNTTTANDQSQPSSAGLAHGGFVTVWTSSGQDGSGLGVYGQRYASTGAASGTEFSVNKTVAKDQSRPVVAALTGGGFVVVYQSNGTDGSGLGVYGRRFSATAMPVGAEFRANTTTRADQSLPSIAGLSDGGFVVAWQSRQDGSGLGVYGQRFNAKGARVGGEFRINTTVKSDQSTPSVSAFTDGGFIAAWASANQDGSGQGIYAQCFNAAGKPVDGEFRVNSTTAKDQSQPSVSAFSAGKFVAVWTSQDQDSSLTGVYGQRFDMDSAGAARPNAPEYPASVASQ